MSENNPFLITPPPGIAPQPTTPADPETAAIGHPEDFITLPPGIADSATHRHPAPTTPAPAVAAAVPVEPVPSRPTSEPVVFFPATPGTAPPRPIAWVLRLPDGTTVAVGRALFIGRNPSATTEFPDAVLRPLDDPARSLSKTHALIELDDEVVWVHDLNSTNGVVIAVPGESVVVVQPGRRERVPDGAELRLGSFVMTIAHV